MSGLFRPGENCWRIESARRAAVLVDGAAYFAAFRHAASRARRSILILGWDVDSRADLAPDGASDGLPTELGPFLDTLVRRRRELEIHVLDWDFVMLYAADRELLPIFKLDWRTHRRLHFHLDGRHPVGSSHHQKIVVVDDRLAFVGGLDLTRGRWDTPEHEPHDERRAADGKAQPPFHDVQWMVEGRVAEALGELARERWRRATGEKLAPPRFGGERAARERGPSEAAAAAASDDRNPYDLWPPTVAPDFEDVAVAISRTEPAYDGREEVQEVKQAYLDAIAAARRWIYLENQYFTAHAIGEALAARLSEPHGPEVVVVTRAGGGGWLEHYTMVALRARLVRRLSAADPHDRLRVLHPWRSDLKDTYIKLHSKLAIVDDRLLRIGSANLNNRSLGFDTECDLSVEATEQDEDARAAVRHTLCRLVGEHLGAPAERVASELDASGSLIAAIDALGSDQRRLAPLALDVPGDLDALLPEQQIVDPERPIDPDRLVDQVMSSEERHPVRRRLAALVLFVTLVAALAAAWRWTPLGDWLDPARLDQFAALLEQSGLAPVVVPAVFVLASVIAVPVTVLIVVTVLVFGPFEGFAYSIVGSLLGAMLSYWIGHLLGRDAVRRLAGARINGLSRRLARRGVLAVLTVRIIPVAPFALINVAAGASHIRLRDFVIGTALGMTPGILAVTVFADRIGAVLRAPSPATLATLTAAAVVIALGAWKLRDWVMRRNSAGQPSQDADRST